MLGKLNVLRKEFSENLEKEKYADLHSYVTKLGKLLLKEWILLERKVKYLIK